MTHLTFLALLLFLVSSGVWAQNRDDADPLFASNELIEVTLAAPFKSIMRERPDEEYVPAKFSYIGSDGNKIEFDIGVRTRGKFRRRAEVCEFAPLRLNFKKSEVKNTLFHKQDKLKLVTHCDDNSREQEGRLVAEYIAYRTLNLLTDTSYRVRLLKIEYVYTDSKRSKKEYAFLIEHDDRLAKRIGMPEVSVPETSVEALNPEHTNLVSIFQYMIGNTDFSPIAAAPGLDCCHNHTLFGAEDGNYYSIPYDFDMSGLVDAPYAAPNPRFKLRSVRERLYRGRCENNGLLPDTLQKLRQARADLESMINDQTALPKAHRRNLQSYIGNFFYTINDPKRLETYVVNNCV